MIKEIIKSSGFVKVGQELFLNGKDCVDLIRSALEKKASLRFKVQGSSMSPFIQNGDIITLSLLPENKIRLGWLIVFTRELDKKLIIHRLVKIIKKPNLRYITKGDNIDKPDDPVSRTDILAYVKKVERKGRIIPFGAGPERRLIAFLSRRNIL